MEIRYFSNRDHKQKQEFRMNQELNLRESHKKHNVQKVARVLFGLGAFVGGFLLLTPVYAATGNTFSGFPKRT
jgi:hypothetical protein